MEFRVIDTTVPVCETLMDTASEQPVDGDFVLPEYCPDVAAVLKCTMSPTVQNRQVSTDRLLVDGVVQIRVLYLDEDRQCVRCCEFSQPFSTAFTLPSVPPNAFMRLTTKTDYVNCRAVSPRRLDIHGAFTLKLTISAASERTGIAAVEGDGVFSRKRELRGTVPVACVEKPFTINEVLDPGENKRPAEQMLRIHMVPTVTDCKVLMNKAIIKGNLTFEGLYLTDAASGAVGTVSGDVPFSQILDLEGLCEEWLCDAEVALVSGELRIDPSQSGETVLLSVNAKLMASLYGWREVNGEMVCDTYSSHCPLITETQSIEMSCLNSVMRDMRTVRQNVDTPSETMQSVLDVWCEVVNAGMSGDTNTATLDGRLLWCMIVCDKSGEISYYERTENFSLTYTDGGVDAQPEVCVCGVSSGISGNGRLELKADLSVTRHCADRQVYTVLSGVTADESAAYPPDKAALKVCYAVRGESLWEIARRCRTSVEAVMEENHLTGDTVPTDTMLLIPLG